MNAVRVDRWLWCVRIFKSRTKATDAIKSGKVRRSDQVLKPSHQVEVGDILEVRKDGFNLQFQVTNLLEKRVGAPIAHECYLNLTSEEEMNKFNDWYIGKAKPEIRPRGSGRPTKKERRMITEFKQKEE